MYLWKFNMKDVKIYSVFHKPYWYPTDNLYVPIQVGFLENLNIPNIIRDNTGDNISEKNKSFCELTAIYWVWKNAKHDYVGIDHYRRHFSLKVSKDKKSCIITEKDILPLLSSDVVILPKKRHYWIETNYSQYAHAHNEIDLIKTKEILASLYPDYIEPFEIVMGKTSGHRFNMMIMPWKVFDSYCTWLFSILFELEKVLDISQYSDYDYRVFGFVAERLLDVYLLKNGIKTRNIGYVFMDNERWGKKILSFVKRKILKK